jgi:hypothetical protein
VASRFKTILAKTLIHFVGDALPQRAADQEQSSIGIPRVSTGLGAAFGEKITDQDITFAVKREPVAHRIVFTVAHDIYDNWFEVEPIKEEEDKEKFNEAVQKVLFQLNAKDVFTQAAVYERAYGWSIIIIGYRDKGEDLKSPVLDATEIADLEAYSPPQIQKVEVDKERESPRFGEPEIYTVMQSESENVEVHHSRVIHFATRKLEPGYKGISVLEPVWDDLTNLRNIRWGMGQTMYRYGSGFPVVTIEGAGKEELEEWSRTWGPLTARTSMFKNEKQEIEFKGLAGRALDPEPYYTPIMENISAGTSIPMAILRGAQAGQLAGSEVNEREYFKLISDCQSRYEPGIRHLIDELIRIGQIQATVKDYKINWIGAFEINPRDQAATELDKTRSLMLKTNWLTINEIRELEGLDPIPGADVVLGLSKIQASQTTTVMNRELSKRKRELQEKFGKPVQQLLAERINRGDSVSKICRDIGISTATFYSWAEEYGLI